MRWSDARVSEHDRGCDPRRQSTDDTEATRCQPEGEPVTVLRDQKKTILVAVVMIVATYWIAGQFGSGRLYGSSLAESCSAWSTT